METADQIIAAATHGDLDRVEALLDADPQLISATNMFGSSAIHAAHYSNHPALVRFLIDRGRTLDPMLLAELGMANALRDRLTSSRALVSEFTAHGSTLLHGACYWGSVAAATVLLEFGADPDLPTQDEHFRIRPLGCAIASPDVPNPSQDEDTVLRLVDLLLDHGANVNGRRRDGTTALHAAAYRGLFNVVRRLVERGADPAIRGLLDGGAHANQLPSDVAAAQGQEAVAALLRSLEP